MASKATNAFWPKNSSSMSAGTWTANATYLDDVFHGRWGTVSIISSPLRRSDALAFTASVQINSGGHTPSNRHSEGTDWNGVNADFTGDHAWQQEGTEGWYGGSVHWPSSSPNPNTWVIVMQMHGNLDGSSPVIAIEARGSKWNLIRRGDGLSSSADLTTELSSLVKDVWYDYLYFVRWNSTSGNGRLEFYWRQAGGPWALRRSDTAGNMYRSGSTRYQPYLQAGVYASSTNQNATFTCYHSCLGQRFTSRQLLEDTLWGSGGTTSPPPPPPPPDPVPDNAYGLTDIGGALGPMSPNAKRGSLITIPQDGTIAAGKVALSTAGVNEPQSIRLVLYADSSGSPGSLITNGSSAALELPTDSPMAWRDVTWTIPPSVTAGTSYWLVLHTDGVQGGNYARASAVGALRWQPSGSDTFSDGSSNPFGTANTDDFRMSAYVVLTPGAVDPGGTNIQGVAISAGTSTTSAQGSVASANSEVPASRVAYFFEPVQVTRSVARPYEVIDGQKGPEVRWNNAANRWERI